MTKVASTYMYMHVRSSTRLGRDARKSTFILWEQHIFWKKVFELPIQHNKT